MFELFFKYIFYITVNSERERNRRYTARHDLQVLKELERKENIIIGEELGRVGLTFNPNIHIIPSAKSLDYRLLPLISVKVPQFKWERRSQSGRKSGLLLRLFPLVYFSWEIMHS